MNLISIFKMFPDQQACIDHLEAIHWPDEASCPYCGGARVARKREGAKVGRWNCHDCRNSFNVLKGTIFRGNVDIGGDVILELCFDNVPAVIDCC